MFIINSMTEAQQMTQAENLMASLKLPNGNPMFPGLANAVLVQHTIRGEVQLSTNATQYNIPVLQNSQGQGVNAATPTSNLLSLQDAFVCTSLGVLMAKKASLTDVAFDTYAWLPANVFSTSGTAAAGVGIYANGSIKLTVNQAVIAPYWDLMRHYNSSRTQPATAADYTASGINYIASKDSSTDGFYPVQPGWFFDGAGNVQMTLQLPGAPAAVEPYQFAVFQMRGFLLQNASQFKR
jgi:hypothetical protein